MRVKGESESKLQQNYRLALNAVTLLLDILQTTSHRNIYISSAAQEATISFNTTRFCRNHFRDDEAGKGEPKEINGASLW
ncbi:hypothetical protein KOW79_003722 [Hemibagrus wyckioides]|uniref:Uncharacterized protein n=1 Tax=Hemibagrus wyckioides TaxID=337641 RepID=A0A9D3P701_9TELE|nr:hypothetical protein KOW79_003722 [Hemibagrus wyckioides]